MITAPLPDFLSISGLFKATPADEAGERMIYMEVSNETVDAQGERVLARALQDSVAEYERFGNVDIDHISIIGARAGIPDYLLYEIGRPVAARVDGPRTFVKAQLYQGDTPVARHANLVWDSLTKVTPPGRWYPSIGGAVLEKKDEIDPDTQARIRVVKRVHWTNIALSRTPVNQALPTTATVPFGVFAKCWSVAGLDWTKAEGLVAGQQYAIADAPGGQALRSQSLDRNIQNYWQFRDRLSADIRAAKVRADRAHPTTLLEHCTRRYGLTPDEAAEYLERFFGDIDRALDRARARKRNLS